MIFPESFTPTERLSIDSTRSPATPVNAITNALDELSRLLGMEQVKDRKEWENK